MKQERIISLSMAQVEQTDIPAENLDSMISVMNEVQTDMVVFPETHLTGNDQTTNLDLFHAVLAETAKLRKQWVVYGFYNHSEGKVHNTARLIDNHGVNRLEYHKLHLWNEKDVVPGTSQEVVSTEIGKIGLLICWDIAHPSSVRTLSQKGAELVLCPSYWYGREFGTTEVIDKLPLVRAFENQVYIGYCDACTPDGSTAALSKICSPTEILAQANPQKRQVISATVDLATLQNSRNLFDCWK